MRGKKNFEKLSLMLFFHTAFILLSLLVYVFKGGLMIYNLVVLLPLAIFLLYENRRYSYKLLREGFILGIFFIMMFELFAIQSKAWFAPSIFNFRPFGDAIEMLTWSPLYALIVQGYYVLFFDRYKAKKLPKENKYWLFFVIMVLFGSGSMYSLFPNIFNIPYFYAVLVSFLMLSDLVLILMNKQLASRAIICTLTLVPVGFFHELISVKLGHWFFEKGHHIGYIAPMGLLIAVEEIIFIIATPVFIVCLYEIVSDNRRA